MGLFASKPQESKPPTSLFAPDYSKATLTGEDLARQLWTASETAKKAAADAVEKAKSGDSKIIQFIVMGFGLIILVLGGILAYDAAAVHWGWSTALLPAPTKPAGGGSSAPSSNILYVESARYGPDCSVPPPTGYTDVTSALQAMISSQTNIPSFLVGWNELGFQEDPYPNQLSKLTVQYYVGQNMFNYVSAPMGSMLPAIPSGGSPAIPAPCGFKSAPPGGNQSAPVSAPPPPFLGKLYSSIFGSGSGDLAPSFHDATTSAIIQGNRAPLSSQKDGAYGMQWWMYVKDWNYGYGKDKSIVVRPDVTNSSVLNPSISLHPTDNSLRVSVSVFPSTSGGTSTSTPAPAGHSGSTDDVFICDVPNIPLQTWFAVGVTVFGRNLDVYIDGKLVKSCFLTGVPKPAVGDIQLTPGGGFSGRICGFNHYPKMLTPSDTAAFWSAGTSCRNKTPDTGAASSATGYSVKFGVYDSLGKEVQEYAF
jgi:hypothetical protein